MYQLNDEHIFIVGAWLDSLEKENILIRCIEKLRDFNIPILLVAHCSVKIEIQKLVDYFIYDEKNELLYFDDIKKLNINSLRYVETDSYYINSYVDFHHDYAVLTNIRNGIKFSLRIGKTKIHYLEYDNIINVKQYYETFITDINNYDFVCYEYDKGSVNKGYCAAYMFSIKNNLALKLLDDITTLYDHFKKNDWRLECYILNLIKRNTNSIKISNYIDVDNSINICYIWNREIFKKFNFYVVVNNDDLYLVFISTSKSYLIEIKYDNSKFYNIFGYQLINIGKYTIGSSIILKYMGLKLFEKKLNESIEKYREKNFLVFKNNL